MPSLRQPVGPLPASIYWRRRLVVLAALALVALLVGWLAFGTGGDGKQKKAASEGSPQPAPAQSITPGASPSGSAITSRPGGSGGGSGGTGGGAAGELNVTGGSTGGNGGSTGGGAGGSSGGSGGSSSGGRAGAPGPSPAVNTPEVMALPICATSQLSLELAPAQTSFAAKDKPRLALTIRNSSGSGCRVNLSHESSSLTITSSTNERVWSSADCIREKVDAWAQIAGNSGVTETFGWDRTRSKPQCASADPALAQPGNYLVQADLTGPSGGPLSARTSIRLEG
ncbi:hypothetical protein [Kitasatospora cheerisanensis]|uniref:hypothetical protein n=1 Tax=Kitasatospora cheerisanensis TaxID=81942 RepID=UPI00055E93A8|nr:hypothetical protein [Kitasatospora cheerisanensis]